VRIIFIQFPFLFLVVGTSPCNPWHLLVTMLCWEEGTTTTPSSSAEMVLAPGHSTKSWMTHQPLKKRFFSFFKLINQFYLIGLFFRRKNQKLEDHPSLTPGISGVRRPELVNQDPRRRRPLRLSMITPSATFVQWGIQMGCSKPNSQHPPLMESSLFGTYKDLRWI